jgi:glycerophosphoryl diester phosphodiesterase
MSSTPDGRYLYPILEGATVADSDTRRRLLFEFSIDAGEFSGGVWQYRTEQPGYLVADMWALDEHRMVVIERDGGRGLTAVFRNVYVVDLRDVGPDGFLVKHKAVDLTAIADPDLISLPPIHAGDVRLGDPFGVACESIEAIHVIDGERILLGCDNNFPNTGRNPSLADDNELIVVKVPGLKSLN